MKNSTPLRQSKNTNLKSNWPESENSHSILASRFERYISLQFDLCGRLEDLADTLPINVDKKECQLISRSVLPILKRAHQFEENLVFPAIIFAFAEDVSIHQTLKRLRCEHFEDESQAGELREGLGSFLNNAREYNTECLAYMLRGLFGGLRRHLANEREGILPLLTELSHRA